MTAADLPLIQRWLALPHVREWWGDPHQQYALVSGDLDEPAIDQYIFSTAADSFGYLQCYDVTEWNTGFGPQPRGTRGIDLFIGEPTMIERGHGSALIRRFVDNLLRTCRAWSRIRIPPIAARSVPTRKPDLKKTAW
jgi:aminoglycoside 6'-N-acetyltransferase